MTQHIQWQKYQSKKGFFGKPYILRSVNTVESAIWCKGTCFGTCLVNQQFKLWECLQLALLTKEDLAQMVSYNLQKDTNNSRASGKVTFIAHNLKLSDQDQNLVSAIPKHEEENLSTSYYQWTKWNWILWSPRRKIMIIFCSTCSLRLFKVLFRFFYVFEK